MFKLIRKNRWFFIPFLIFFIAASTILLLYTKSDIHLFLNSFHCNLGDFFFKHITHLGDGIVIVVFIFILLFIRYRHSIIMLISTLTVTIIVQGFKRFWLPDIDRPKIFFYQMDNVYYVPDIEIHTAHSFPSGHTATAFIMFLFIAFICKNNYLKLFSFIVAFFVAYSRVYLSQHFLNDIYFSSIFAIFFTSLFYIWITGWKNNKLDLSLIHTLGLKKKNGLSEKN